MMEGLERYANDEESAVKFGIDYATQQCDELLRAGVPGIHMYTLNKVASTAAVVKNLKLA